MVTMMIQTSSILGSGRSKTKSPLTTAAKIRFRGSVEARKHTSYRPQTIVVPTPYEVDSTSLILR